VQQDTGGPDPTSSYSITPAGTSMLRTPPPVIREGV
jgi:hypothetical protein